MSCSLQVVMSFIKVFLLNLYFCNFVKSLAAQHRVKTRLPYHLLEVQNRVLQIAHFF
jgi:hypothetical protein